MLDQQTTAGIAENIASFLVTIPSVVMVQPFMNWNLVTSDGDENGFAYCAISAGAACIITNDAHFNI